MRLIQAEVATGHRKTLDRGVAVAGLLGGTAAPFRFAHRNPKIQLRGTGCAHDPLVLARQHQFTAINTALGVDLSGQVNAEERGGRYVGLIVTEHGVADLRGAPVSVRYERMLAIAHPEHRAALAAELEEHLMNGALR